SLLLDHGRAIAVDSTPDVITRYMTLLRQHRAVSQDRPVVITAVSVRDAAGPCRRFQSGQKAWVDIEVVAREHTERCAVVLYLLDDSHYELFVTSTERLGHGNFTLDVGDTFCCTFELQLNLGPGAFYLSVNLFRYDNEEWHDSWEAAETIYVSADRDTTGPVNCFPRVVRQEIHAYGRPQSTQGYPAQTRAGDPIKTHAGLYRSSRYEGEAVGPKIL
ncbi:MAG: Wzt carbohydrate-binding domain-containing protein, partial [Deltaproteobacteria bacterium]|nr:Wzt carbohydrate-binding domain-containing protein [Deltaproteobacteria bacterium]